MTKPVLFVGSDAATRNTSATEVFMPSQLPELFDAIAAKSTRDTTPVDKAQIIAELKQIDSETPEVQCLYHPVFGLSHIFGVSVREKLFRETVEIIQGALSTCNPAQVRILDIGCNLGYATLSLAARFPNTIGIDVSPGVVSFASLLSDYNDSPALFRQLDAITLLSDAQNLEALDCVLMLNMVHQLIFLRGLPFVQAFIAKISRNVDFMFVELANREDYVSHGKDDLLPMDAEEVFAQCTASSITLLRSSPRPLYVLKRQRITVGDDSYPVNHIKFAENSAHFSRKYFSSGPAFIKQMRMTPKQNVRKSAAEAAFLGKLSGTGVAPRLINWHTTPGTGYVVMERVFGRKLSDACHIVCADKKVQEVVQSILRAAALMAEKGFFHNDFSPHNMILSSQYTICIVDFEQADTKAITDHFALLSWTVYDLLAGQAISYDRDIYAELRRFPSAETVDRQLYAPFRLGSATSRADQFIRAILAGDSWKDFVAEWSRIFAQEVVFDPKQYDAYEAMCDLSGEDRSPPATPAMVVDAFRLILGREPENQAIIDLHMRLRTKAALERQLRSSQEYRGLLPEDVVRDAWRTLGRSDDIDPYRLASLRKARSREEVMDRIRLLREGSKT